MASEFLTQVKHLIEIEDFIKADSLKPDTELSSEQKFRYQYLLAKSNQKQFKYQVSMDNLN